MNQNLIPYLVQNPTTYVTTNSDTDNGTWIGHKYEHKNFVWRDPNVKFSDNTYPSKGKSIFDPSPLGWKLISEDGLKDFKVETMNYVGNYNQQHYEPTRQGFPTYTLGTKNTHDYVAGENEYRGLVYWPNVNPWLNTDVPSTLIYFPVSMIRKRQDGTLDCVEVSSYTANLKSERTAGEFLVSGGHPAHINPCDLSWGLNARCVKILSSTSN